MKTATETFLLPCTTDTFWRVFMDEGYVRSLYLDALGSKAFELLERDASSRKLRIVPRLSLPAPLTQLIGDAFAYEEHGTLDRSANQWTWRMVQPAGSGGGGAPKKAIVTTSGTVRVEASGSGQCVRTDRITLEGKVFGLGGLIEASAEKEARSAWAKERVFFTGWLAREPR